MAVKTIRTVEELYRLIDVDFKEDSIIFDPSFSVGYRLIGADRKGTVDINTAKYVKSLHDAIAQLYSVINDTTLNEARKKILKNAPIEVKIKDGSKVTELIKDNFNTIIEELLKGFRTMDDNHKAIIYKYLIVCTLIGFVSYQTISAVAQSFDNAVDVKSSIETIDGIERIIERVQKPQQVTAEGMNNDDKIIVIATNEELTKKEAVKRFKIIKTNDIQTVRADDVYMVIELKNIEGESDIKGKLISQDNIVVNVKFSITNDEKQRIWESFDSRSYIQMNLNVDLKNDKIDKGVVSSLDEAREGAKSLKMILDDIVANQ